MGRQRKKKSVESMTNEELTRLVVDFVKRLRRIALHPLALQETADDPMPGGFLRQLMEVEMEVTMDGDQPQTLTTVLPDEVQFESLAARARPFTLETERLYWKDLLRALERLLGSAQDRTLEGSLNDLRDEWWEATGRDNRIRTYWVHLPVQDIKLTDVDLAYAWLYQDLAHGDEAPADGVGIHQRFEAAVGVFSHLAVVGIETLHFINELVAIGQLSLPVGTFSSPVTISPDGCTMKVTSLAEVNLDADLNEVMAADGPVPKTARSVTEIAKELRAQGYWRDAQQSADRN
jgi:hypothetical protein